MANFCTPTARLDLRTTDFSWGKFPATTLAELYPESRQTVNYPIRPIQGGDSRPAHKRDFPAISSSNEGSGFNSDLIQRKERFLRCRKPRLQRDVSGE
jgi:hypothetical protein